MEKRIKSISYVKRSNSIRLRSLSLTKALHQESRQSVGLYMKSYGYPVQNNQTPRQKVVQNDESKADEMPRVLNSFKINKLNLKVTNEVQSRDQKDHSKRNYIFRNEKLAKIIYEESDRTLQMLRARKRLRSLTQNAHMAQKFQRYIHLSKKQKAYPKDLKVQPLNLEEIVVGIPFTPKKKNSPNSEDRKTIFVKAK